MQGVKFYRRARGLSQRELSSRSGVMKKTICAIETGKVEEPRPATLRKLADALDVEPMDLMLGEATVVLRARWGADGVPDSTLEVSEKTPERHLEGSKG